MKGKIILAIVIFLLSIGMIIAPPVVYILGYMTNEFAIGYLLVTMSLNQLAKFFMKIAERLNLKLNR